MLLVSIPYAFPIVARAAPPTCKVIVKGGQVPQASLVFLLLRQLVCAAMAPADDIAAQATTYAVGSIASSKARADAFRTSLGACNCPGDVTAAAAAIYNCEVQRRQSAHDTPLIRISTETPAHLLRRVTYDGTQLEHSLPALHAALTEAAVVDIVRAAAAAHLAPGACPGCDARARALCRDSPAAHAELHSRAQAWLEQVVPFHLRRQVAAAADTAAALAAAAVQRKGVLPWLCSFVEPVLQARFAARSALPSAAAIPAAVLGPAAFVGDFVVEVQLRHNAGPARLCAAAYDRLDGLGLRLRSGSDGASDPTAAATAPATLELASAGVPLVRVWGDVEFRTSSGRDSEHRVAVHLNAATGIVVSITIDGHAQPDKWTDGVVCEAGVLLRQQELAPRRISHRERERRLRNREEALLHQTYPSLLSTPQHLFTLLTMLADARFCTGVPAYAASFPRHKDKAMRQWDVHGNAAAYAGPRLARVVALLPAGGVIEADASTGHDAARSVRCDVMLPATAEHSRCHACDKLQHSIRTREAELRRDAQSTVTVVPPSALTHALAAAGRVPLDCFDSDAPAPAVTPGGGAHALTGTAGNCEAADGGSPAGRTDIAGPADALGGGVARGVCSAQGAATPGPAGATAGGAPRAQLPSPHTPVSKLSRDELAALYVYFRSQHSKLAAEAAAAASTFRRSVLKDLAAETRRLHHGDRERGARDDGDDGGANEDDADAAAASVRDLDDGMRALAVEEISRLMRALGLPAPLVKVVEATANLCHTSPKQRRYAPELYQVAKLLNAYSPAALAAFRALLPLPSKGQLARQLKAHPRGSGVDYTALAALRAGADAACEHADLAEFGLHNAILLFKDEIKTKESVQFGADGEYCCDCGSRWRRRCPLQSTVTTATATLTPLPSAPAASGTPPSVCRPTFRCCNCEPLRRQDRRQASRSSASATNRGRSRRHEEQRRQLDGREWCDQQRRSSGRPYCRDRCRDVAGHGC
jgi:hypothetical protein